MLKPDGYLTTEQIFVVEPLDAQMGVWPLKNVPDGLMDPLFSQPEVTDVEKVKYGKNIPRLKTYAILDAAKMPYLLTGLLETSNLRFQCLFQGEAEQDLGEAPPFIVEIELKSPFTRALFTDVAPPVGLWSKDLGIFFRSRASFEDLRRHFRRFTRVQDKDGKWRFFRFWEGRVAGEILEQTNCTPQLAYIYLGDEDFDISSCIFRNLDGHFYVSRKTDTFSGQTDRKSVRYEDIATALKTYAWKNFIMRLLEDFEVEFGTAGENRGYHWVKETCDAALSSGFKIELAIYNYVRSRHTAEIKNIDFQNALDWSYQQNPGCSTLEISKHLWGVINQIGTR